MKAELSLQQKMLELQDIDLQLTALEHRKRSIPQRKELETQQALAEKLYEEVVRTRTEVFDVEREVTKAEADVQLVRDRADRTNSRLEAGQGSAKELESMQREMTSLGRRQAELEEIQLGVMEKAEGLRTDQQKAEQAKASVDEKVVALEKEIADAEAALDRERSVVQQRREQFVPQLLDLADVYEAERAKFGGLAVAALRERRCGGCGLELNASERARIKAADEDEMLRCEDCSRILIRTDESGL